jgi:YidC/Oxa1 family membrane protein insertase
LDQRRFIAFLAVSMGAMLLFNVLFPPAKPVPPPGQGAPAVAKVAAKDGEKAAQPAAKPENESKAKDVADKPAANIGPLPAVAAANAPEQFVTLGSLDMNSDYRMLVTLTSAGAAVHRAEMASSRFRDQHDWTGYLGDLELKDAKDGIQVQVVGAGTPAAAATANGQAAPIAVDDVITGIGNPQVTAIKTVADFNKELARTEPGQEIVLQVRHGDAPPQPRTVKLVRRPLAVLRPEAENYALRDAPLPAGFVDRPSFLISIASLNNAAIPKDDAQKLANLLESGTWELTDHDESSATFRRALPELKLELTKRYKLAQAKPQDRDNPNFPAYDLQFEIELHNTSDEKQSVAYRLDGPTGMPLEGWWYARKISQSWGGGGLRDVAVRFAGSAELSINDSQIAKGKIAPMGDGQALAYAGVDGQYFSAMLLPQIAALDDVWFDTTEAVVVGPTPEPRDYAYTNVTSRMTRKSIDLAPDAKFSDKYRVFIGPKRPDLLAEYYPANDPNYSLKDILYYGWFGSVARAMLFVLHIFYRMVGNYGIAILMLTILVRMCMFPISFKQTQNMARIQALKPEMDRINEKFKDDLQKKSQATQDLYRKNNINPVAGCLPMFLQLPIFMGLYRALMVDVELRQSPFFGESIRWCSNLAAPDMLWNWSAIMPDFVTKAQGLFGLGPYLNIFPLITVCLFLVTQQMTMPAPTNEQGAMQQKMMKYMTLFMGLMFYKVASGLCLYFIASSLWGIAERKLLPKPKPGSAVAASGASFGSGKRSGGGNGNGSANGRSGSKKSKTGKKK